MRDTHWLPLTDALSQVPAAVQPWIFLPSSLTEALKAIATDFNVEVLEEAYISLAPELASYFPGVQCSRFFSRKVLLKNGQQAWVAAHTLIPESSLHAELKAFSNLRQRPLGELLFADPSVSKDAQEFTQFKQTWGRRNRYWLHQQPLLVSEFFLDELFCHE